MEVHFSSHTGSLVNRALGERGVAPCPEYPSNVDNGATLPADLGGTSFARLKNVKGT